jgi:class 3 adenylate cyclase
MSRPSDKVQRTHKVVVFFDICSSTTILEDLLRTENQRRWRDLLIRLKQFLVEESEDLGFLIYKFLGDGWVLLFDAESIRGKQLISFLTRLDKRYQRLFHSVVSAVLGGTEHTIGITFGVDEGTLIRIIMTQREEFVGRALNVAARLQGAIKQKDNKPEGKVLISKNAFVLLALDSGQIRSTLVSRELRNISGGKRYQARKISLRMAK